jgi:metal-dependent amidase/aminoacylase/carboxypeptidase family protein
MPVIDRIADFCAETAESRHQIHHPETAFEEYKTAELVSQLLNHLGSRSPLASPEPV